MEDLESTLSNENKFNFARNNKIRKCQNRRKNLKAQS